MTLVREGPSTQVAPLIDHTGLARPSRAASGDCSARFAFRPRSGKCSPACILHRLREPMPAPGRIAHAGRPPAARRLAAPGSLASRFAPTCTSARRIDPHDTCVRHPSISSGRSASRLSVHSGRLRSANPPPLASGRLCRISKAWIYEGAGDFLAVLLDDALATCNRVPPSSHARFHFIDHPRSCIALK